jgi:ankyrin repeat protein
MDSATPLKATLNGLDSAGLHPIHYCAQGGHVKALLLLLKAGVPADALNEAGRTALAVAVAANQLGTSAVLIAVDADLTAQLPHPAEDASHFSAETSEELVQMLLVPDQSEHVRSAKYQLSLFRIPFKLSRA